MSYFFIIELFRQKGILIFEKCLDVFVIILITQQCQFLNLHLNKGFEYLSTLLQSQQYQCKYIKNYELHLLSRDRFKHTFEVITKRVSSGWDLAPPVTQFGFSAQALAIVEEPQLGSRSWSDIKVTGLFTVFFCFHLFD